MKKMHAADVFFCLCLSLIVFCSSFNLAFASNDIWSQPDPIYSNSQSNGTLGGPGSGKHTITGMVRDAATLEGVEGVTVYAQEVDSFVVEALDSVSGEVKGTANVELEEQKVHAAVTLSDGSYAFSDLDPGNYTVRVDAKSTQYINEFYGGAVNKESAQPIVVRSEQTPVVADFLLQKGGTLTGHVFNASTSSAVAGAIIKVSHFSSEIVLGSAASTPDGAFSVTGLPTGKYRVLAVKKPDFEDKFFGGSDDADTAVPVEITALANTPVTIQMVALGKVSGTVLNEKDEPVSGVKIMAYTINDDPESSLSRPLGQTVTDSDGNYTVAELPQGTYRVVADAPMKYVPSIYNNKGAGDAPTPVSLSEGQLLTDINFILVEGASIQGLVTAHATGVPLSNIRLSAVDQQTGVKARYVMSKADGRYSIDKLLPGTYIILAESPDYVSEYFDNAQEPATAKIIQVTERMIRGNVDFQLTGIPVEHTGFISGQVRWEAQNTAIANSCVYAFNIATNRMEGFNCTDTNGNYRIEALPDNEYRLCSRTTTTYISECFDDIALMNSANATPVLISEGQGVNGVDFGLLKYGSIAGHIYLSEENEEVGSYAISNLVPGQYTLRLLAKGTGFRSMYYPQEFSAGASDPIVVGDGGAVQADFSVTVSADSSLAMIAGSVSKSSGGSSLSYMPVQVISVSDQSVVQEVLTRIDGSYLLTEVPVGSYYVMAASSGKDFLPTYYDNSYHIATSTQLHLQEGDSVSQIDFSLVTGGSISGNVMKSDGPSVSGVKVCAVSTVTNRGSCALTDNSGKYEIAGLGPESYRVSVETAGSGYFNILERKYFNNKNSAATADVVPLPKGANLASINFTLPKLASVSGTVVDEKTGRGVSGVLISLFDAQTKAIVSNLSAKSLANGTYLIRGVPAGRYIANASLSGSLYQSEYYNNVQLQAEAQVFEVEAGVESTNVNFSLALTGAIAGSVKRADTGEGLAGIMVHVYEAQSGKGVIAGRTLVDGSYVIRGLKGGRYKIGVSSVPEEFEGIYYENSQDLPGASEVTIVPGEIASEIDLLLPLKPGN